MTWAMSTSLSSAEELNAVRSIATVAPLRNNGCTVPVGNLPISPPEDDIRDVKRHKVLYKMYMTLLIT